MKIAVKDACVLIDLINGGLIGAWFQLGIETWTTDLVIRQVRKESQWPVVEALQATGVIKVKSFSDAELKKVRDFQYAASLGIEDQSVLFLANELKAVLITSDKKLRAQASAAKVRMMGILGILDELLAKSIITQQAAAEKLQAMMDQGAFLPSGECQKRLELWNHAS